MFTRELLLQRVWNYDYLGDSRLVDVAVQRLRAKVEEDPARPALIITVRGVGYRLDPPGARDRGPAARARLRRRLTLAFVLVAAVAAGAWPARSSWSVRPGCRTPSTGPRPRRNLALASDILSGDGPEGFVEPFERLRGFPTLLLVGGAPLRVQPAPGRSRIRRDLKAVDRGQLGYERTAVAERQVPGDRRPGPRPEDAELYFVFAEEELWTTSSNSAHPAGRVGVVVVLAGLVGRAVAGRALRPVAAASAAARSIAEGLLDTRLPVGRGRVRRLGGLLQRDGRRPRGEDHGLSEAQARERRFTSDVAHELRTPLTAIVGEASLLRDHLEAMPPEARRPASCSWPTSPGSAPWSRT